MSDAVNPLAPHVLPSFITAPHETDVVLVGVGVFLLVLVFLLGVGFFWLHSLPDRIAHKGHKIQFEIVAVLCLLSLLTHNNALWGAALLLALIDVPDFGAPLGRIAGALERLARGDTVVAHAHEPGHFYLRRAGRRCDERGAGFRPCARLVHSLTTGGAFFSGAAPFRRRRFAAGTTAF